MESLAAPPPLQLQLCYADIEGHPNDIEAAHETGFFGVCRAGVGNGSDREVQMIRAAIVCAVIGLVLITQPVNVQSKDQSAPEDIEGLWVGAFELEKELVYLRVELKSEDEDIKLTVLYMLPGAPGVVGDVRLESSRVNFKLTRDSDTIVFDGRLQGDTITGVVEHTGESGTFGLVRWVQVDDTLYDDYMGAYELEPGRVVFIRRHDFLKPDPPFPISTSWLSYVEASGRVGRLYPSSETTFFSGPTYLVPFPVEVEVTFVRNQEGKVSGLVWRERGRAERAAPRSTLYREENVTFRNGDITLAGRLLVPNTKGPHPAVIMVQGGGPTNRNLPVFPEYVFARHGIAALVYDGRGTGASTGGAWRESSFGDLAEDALAGVEFLRRHKDINPKQVGIWGLMSL